MAIRHLTNDPELADAIIRQLDLWEKISERSRRQLGPRPFKKPVDDIPLDEFVAATPDERRRSTQETSPGFEYKQDGAKTIVVMATTLFEEIFQYWEYFYGLPLEAIERSEEAKERLNEIWREVSQATRTVLSYFSERSNIIEFEELRYYGPPDMPYPDFSQALGRWLMDYSLPEEREQDSLPFYQSYPVADRQFPFITFKAAGRQDYSMETRPVYWLGRGVNAAYVDTLPRDDDPRWEEQRLQFTLPRPYLLLCNGVLRGEQWWTKALLRLGEELKADTRGLKPVLIILADGVDRETPFPEGGFYALVLPAPHDHTFNPDQPLVAARPRLQAMATAFDMEVVDLEQTMDPKNGKSVNNLVGYVGQCDLAQIDRQRTVLFPAADRPLEDDAPAIDWHAQSMYTFVLPDQSEETIGEAEAAMRWRIEADEGIAAGAGAAFHWAAAGLARENEGSDISPEDEPSDHDDGEADDIFDYDDWEADGPTDGLLPDETDMEIPFEPVVWVQEALRAPLRQLLENAGIDYEGFTGGRVRRWVDEVDAPRRTFRLNADEGDSPILGEATTLGLVTPVPEIRRTITLATNLAWLLILYEFGAISRRELEAH